MATDESDEWASDLKKGVLALVRREVLQERAAIVRMIENALHRHNRDSEALLELLSSVTARKLKFGGVQI
jgi:hypothetical protein